MHFFGLHFAALAAVAIAVPLDVIVSTTVHWSYETAVVYVNPAGDTLSKSSSQAASETARERYHGHHFMHHTSSAVSTYSVQSTEQATEQATEQPETTIQKVVVSSPTSTLVPVVSTTHAAPVAPTTSTKAYVPAPTSTSSPATTSATSPSSTGDSCATASDPAYCQSALDAHNVHRANHSVPALEWSQMLADLTNARVSNCTFQDYGQDGTLKHGSNAQAGSSDVASAVHSWYNGEEPLWSNNNLYGMASPPTEVDGCETMHMSAMIWKTTTQVGCATNSCPTVYAADGTPMSDMIRGVTLCFYLEGGNMLGSFAENVLTPLGQPTYPEPTASP